MMLGLGERENEVLSSLEDLRRAGCRVVTLGQYLAPSGSHVPVREFVPPEAFQAYEAEAYALGFESVASGPFVRSSYMAEQVAGNLPGGASSRSMAPHRT
jgi:lipoic acid synthetase